MGKQEGSRKLAIIYVLTYAFIAVALVLGVNNEKAISKNDIALENIKELAFNDVFNNGVSQKETKYLALEEISGDEEQDTKNSIVVELAKGILDGSFVDDIISNDKVVKSNALGLLKLPAVTTFSGDLIVLDEQVSGEENIVISEEVVEEPVIEEPTVDENGVPTNYVRYIDCQATAYCLCKKCTGKTPGSSGYGRTASGYVITPGNNEKVIAVDKKQIPLGTKVYVEGLNGAPSYGYALAADTGGAIKGNKIDLYYDSHAECLKWGRRQVRVYILPNE